jgi:hypothetical protein
MRKTAISEVINAYSIAVAPTSSERKALDIPIIPNPFDKGADSRGALSRPRRTVASENFLRVKNVAAIEVCDDFSRDRDAD